MAMTALRIGCGLANAKNENTTNAARDRAHYFFGLPEPSFDNRRMKEFVDKHVKVDDSCDPSLLLRKTHKVSKQSKVQKFMSFDPEVLHEGWCHYSCN